MRVEERLWSFPVTRLFKPCALSRATKNEQRLICLNRGWTVHVILLVLIGSVLLAARVAAGDGVTFSCDSNNDLYLALTKTGIKSARYDTVKEAIEHTPAGSGVLVLADGYPAKRTIISEEALKAAHSKHLRLYIEYPQSLPGITFGPSRGTTWERAVAASDAFAEVGLNRLRILSTQGCQFIPVEAAKPDLSLARVAGYDQAVYGLPREVMPLLFRDAQGDWVATTKLSNFITGRYVPSAAWLDLWSHLLATLEPSAHAPHLVAEPSVRPAYARDAILPKQADAQAAAGYARWVEHAGLLIAPSRRDELLKLMRAGIETISPPAADEPEGDGSLGIMEGFASQIQPDGNQVRRLPLRADCQAETAMALALHATLSKDAKSREIAKNLLDFLYFNSGLQGGVRGNPKHPAYGLVSWGAVTPAWEIANYGDDNARTLLATMAAAACLKSKAWDTSMLKALLANLRTTGKLGFRGDRIDIPALEQNGWRFYHDAATVNYAPHFECYLWACDLWAYQHTGQREFLDPALNGIAMTMHAYPEGWRWRDNTERARMLLPLAWLLRVSNTPEHRDWLTRIAGDLLSNQRACGAIQEGLGRRGVPASNEAYGTAETLLVQEKDDPVSDQLYTTGFALLGLHEAAAATGDAKLKAAEDRLAVYLMRIQNRSERIPSLDGSWFRAFDYHRWETWASSADVGWGAWSVEAGWGQAWTAATLAMRAEQISLWELTAGSSIRDQFPAVESLMSQNSGGPWHASAP